MTPDSNEASALRAAPGPLALSTAAAQDPQLLRAQAEIRRAQGDELGALAHLLAAQTLEDCAVAVEPDALRRLYNVATGYFLKEQDASAEQWYHLLLTLDAEWAGAYQNLAAIYERNGLPAQSAACRERAYAIQRLFVEPVSHAARRLLILSAGACAGNVPFDTLLSSAKSTRIKYVIDYATPQEDRQLPPFDLVFNAIGEPDVAAALLVRLEQFAAHCDRPWMNAPAAVVRTQRHRLPALLAGLEDVVIAPCVRGEAPPRALSAWLNALGLSLPLLLRPAASHGGQGMERCATLEQLEQALAAISGPWYLTPYIDYRNSDGWFRKYRMVFVDRQALPYHLAISRHWMVHYFSAEMAEQAWKIDEEHEFLRDPQSALGARAMRAIAAIGRRLDLDYAGVDFTLLPDGRVLVFEANATMLVHRERIDGMAAHKNPYVERIVCAFEQLQLRLAACAPLLAPKDDSSHS